MLKKIIPAAIIGAALFGGGAAALASTGHSNTGPATKPSTTSNTAAVDANGLTSSSGDVQKWTGKIEGPVQQIKTPAGQTGSTFTDTAKTK